ncbi:MAG TPA: hypothetical protein VGH87_16670, partial [Polyangiaceae bacterium]
MEHRVGTTLRGKYLLERVLGAGSMGTVFAATHRNGMPVAIKVLNPDFSRNADVLRRFVREGYIANRVKHPGVDPPHRRRRRRRGHRGPRDGAPRRPHARRRMGGA